MIGRSFATEDAHDKIRAAVVDLFEVLELELEANTEEVTFDNFDGKAMKLTCGELFGTRSTFFVHFY